MYLSVITSAFISAFIASEDMNFLKTEHLPNCDVISVFVRSDDDSLSVSLESSDTANVVTVSQEIRDRINKISPPSNAIKPTTFSYLGQFGEGAIVSARGPITVSGTYWVPHAGDPVRLTSHAQAVLAEGHGQTWLLSGPGTFIPGSGTISQLINIVGEPIIGDTYPLPLQPIAHAITNEGFIVATAMGPVDVHLSGLTRHAALGYPPASATDAAGMRHFAFPTSVAKQDGRIYVGGEGGYAEYEFVEDGYRVSYYELERCKE